MKRFMVLSLVGAVCAINGRADELYSFSFTPSSGPIKPFTFSFTAPTFVSAGQSPAFTPLTLTDGVNSASLTRDLTALNGPNSLGCFDFGTATNSNLGFNTPCGVGARSPNGGFLLFQISGPLPTADGAYPSIRADAAFYTGVSSFDQSLGSGTLTVSAVPEPSSMILTLTILLGAALAARKQSAGLN